MNETETLQSKLVTVYLQEGYTKAFENGSVVVLKEAEKERFIKIDENGEVVEFTPLNENYS
jgi:hypothetical protein|nr:MAG TPA: hypothetical protein [Caudoviricetes sp.]DAV92709.1 MAG TPA: hypothetical protein [Caudoviricetes sp.]